MDRQETERKMYSEAFKQMVLSEVKAGLSVISVSTKYEIGGSMTVYRWCKKYGIKATKQVTIDVPLEISQSIEMSKDKGKKLIKKESDKIKLLEYELALYKKLVEIAKRDYNLDLLKKPDTKPSEK